MSQYDTCHNMTSKLLMMYMFCRIMAYCTSPFPSVITIFWCRNDEPVGHIGVLGFLSCHAYRSRHFMCCHANMFRYTVMWCHGYRSMRVMMYCHGNRSKRIVMQSERLCIVIHFAVPAFRRRSSMRWIFGCCGSQLGCRPSMGLVFLRRLST